MISNIYYMIMDVEKLIQENGETAILFSLNTYNMLRCFLGKSRIWVNYWKINMIMVISQPQGEAKEKGYI